VGKVLNSDIRYRHRGEHYRKKIEATKMAQDRNSNNQQQLHRLNNRLANGLQTNAHYR